MNINVKLAIERLEFEGLGMWERRQLKTTIEAELGRLFMHAEPTTGPSHRQSFPGGTFDVDPGRGFQQSGRRIAQALYGQYAGSDPSGSAPASKPSTPSEGQP